jgi:hypothetical protein
MIAAPGELAGEARCEAEANRQVSRSPAMIPTAGAITATAIKRTRRRELPARSCAKMS